MTRRWFQPRPMVRLALLTALGVALGIGARDAWDVPYWAFWLAALPFAALSLCLSLYKKNHTRKFPVWMLAFLLLVAGRSALAAYPPVPPRIGEGTLTGTLQAPPLPKTKTQLYILENCTLRAQGDAQALPYAVYLYAPALPDAKRGMTIEATARVELPDPPRNPGGFDARGYYRRKGVGYTAFAKDIAVRGASKYDLLYAMQVARAHTESVLSKLLPGEAGAVLHGMLLGDTLDIDITVMEEFRRTGIAHILSVSGLHVGFITLLLMQVLRFTGGSLRLRFALLALLLAGYAFLVGGQPSIVRAVLLALCANLGLLFERKADTPSSLALAFCLILWARPLDLYDVGLQLSFSAVAGILLLQPLFRFRRLPKWLADSLSVSLGAQLGTLPLCLYYFGTVSLIATVVNLFAVPLCAVIVMGGFCVTLLGMLWLEPIAYVAKPLGWLIELFLWTIRHCARIPYAYIIAPPPSALTIGAFFAALLFASRYFLGSRRLRAVLLSVCVATTALYAGARWIGEAGSAELLALDVGQGNAALLRVGHKRYMIDCGPINGEADRVAWANCPALDAVIITHPHLDHFGGLPALLARVRVKRIYLPAGKLEADAGFAEAMALARKLGVQIHALREGDALWLDAATRIDVLASGQDEADANERGLVLRYARATAQGEQSVLFTGDIGAATEARLARFPPTELLYVAHHGSKGSSSSAFLERAQPALALLSVGRRNGYGHPAPETLERLRAVGARIERTDISGALRAYWDHSGTYFSVFLPE